MLQSDERQRAISIGPDLGAEGGSVVSLNLFALCACVCVCGGEVVGRWCRVVLKQGCQPGEALRARGSGVWEGGGWDSPPPPPPPRMLQGTHPHTHTYEHILLLLLLDGSNILVLSVFPILICFIFSKACWLFFQPNSVNSVLPQFRIESNSGFWNCV